MIPCKKKFIFIFLLFAIVMGSDTFAYFIGRKWGKSKFFSHLSPKKTKEGACGGIFGGVFGAFLVNYFFPGSFGSSVFLLILASLAAVSLKKKTLLSYQEQQEALALLWFNWLRVLDVESWVLQVE